MKLILFVVFSLFPCRDILKNLKGHKDEDLLKGQAVKNQKDKALEFRFLLQKAFSSSHRLPQEPVRSLFCDSHEGVNAAYSDLNSYFQKTEVTTGAADIKSEPHAFNQNISEQVASYIKDASRMVRQMQMWKLAVAVFGSVPVGESTAKGKRQLFLLMLPDPNNSG
ncbi:unnamed protein product [Malus baccata var. baccata]